MTFSCPGFTALPAAGGSNMSAQLLYRVTDGTEGSTFTLTSSIIHLWGVIGISYSGEAQSSPFDPVVVPAPQVSPSGTNTIANTGVTTQFPKTQLVWFGGAFWSTSNGAPTLTQPAGYTTQIASQVNTGPGSGASNISMLVADAPMTVPGTTGAVNGSQTETHQNFSLLIGIADASAFSSATLITRPRTWFAARPRRGRVSMPVPPQGNQGTKFPLITRPAGRWPKVLPELRRARMSLPPLPQGVQAVQFPLFTRYPGPRPRFGSAQVRRGRVSAPTPAQGNQGVRFPLITRPARHAIAGNLMMPARRRARVFMPPLKQAASGIGFNPFTRPATMRTRLLPPPRAVRARTFPAPFTQGNRGTPLASFTRRGRLWLPERHRARIRGPLIAAPVQSASAIITGRGSVTASATVTQRAAAAITGQGSVSIIVQAVRAAQAQITGRGSVSIAPVVTTRPVIAITGRGSVLASATLVSTAASAITGRGSVVAGAQVTQHATAVISGRGSVSISAATSPGIVITARGSVAVTAGPVTVPAQAAITGQGSVAITAQAARPQREIIIQPSWRAPWDEVAEDGTWQRQGPLEGPSVVETDALQDGLYDDEDTDST